MVGGGGTATSIFLPPKSCSVDMMLLMGLCRCCVFDFLFVCGNYLKVVQEEV